MPYDRRLRARATANLTLDIEITLHEWEETHGFSYPPYERCSEYEYDDENLINALLDLAPSLTREDAQNLVDQMFDGDIEDEVDVLED